MTNRRRTLERPRVEGERMRVVCEATLGVLAEVGYDRLTMDGVAARAKASKATLYRRWTSKAALVIDALINQQELSASLPDTGTLRGDLLAMFSNGGFLTDGRQVALIGGVITAIDKDREFADDFRDRFMSARIRLARRIYERARDRGEIQGHVDLDVLVAALPGTVLHLKLLSGNEPTPDLVARVIDELILPAIARR